MSFQPPPLHIVQRFRPAFEYLIPRARFLQARNGGALTSWYRDPEANKRVGGNVRSQHLLGFAWDVVPADFDTYVREATEVGLVAIDEGDHVHVQLFPRGSLRGIL